MIALAPHAAPATSPLDLFAAEVPTASPKAAGGSFFHSLLQAATDANGRIKPASDARARYLSQVDTDSSDHPKTKAAVGDSVADDAPSVAVSIPPQRINTAPITLNAFPARDDSDNNGRENPAVPPTAASGLTEIPATVLRVSLTSVMLGALRARTHSTAPPAANANDRPRIKSTKKDAAADNIPAADIPAPPQRTDTPPITLNALSARDDSDKTDKDNSDRPSIAEEVSANPPTAQSAPEIQLVALTVNASAADGSLSKIEPALEVRLQPVALRESPAAMQEHPDSDAAASEPVPVLTQAAPTSSKHGNDSRHPEQGAAQEPASVVRLDDMAQAKFDAAAPAPAATSSSNAASRSDAPATTGPAQAPEPPPGASSPAAHDIKLELNGGGQRVEVRLTDRGGDIHVAVRTPDARLSNAMREDLPALAAKLEQSGFRTDVDRSGAWQTSGERRTVETGAASSSRDSQEHSRHDGQRRQDNPQQQNPKNPGSTPNRKADRKDFSWLLQTYR